jgi:hypothetical protein
MRASEFQQTVLDQLGDQGQRMARMEQGLSDLRGELLGNGQPGRIGRLEADVAQLKTTQQRSAGEAAATRRWSAWLRHGATALIGSVAGYVSGLLHHVK